MIQENTPWQKNMMQKAMLACEMANCINDFLHVIGIRVAYDDAHQENCRRQYDGSAYLKKIDDNNTEVHVELVRSAETYYVGWDSNPVLGLDGLENCTYGILNSVTRFVFLKNGKTVDKKENPYLGCSSLEEAMIRKDMLAEEVDEKEIEDA